MKELAEQVVQACESDSEFRFLELPQDDPSQRCPDITLANAALNWNPTVTLRDGLRKTVDWFRASLADAVRD